MATKHFMVSATYVPSQDVLEQQNNRDKELNNFSVRLSIKTDPVWRGLRRVYVSTLRKYPDKVGAGIMSHLTISINQQAINRM